MQTRNIKTRALVFPEFRSAQRVIKSRKPGGHATLSPGSRPGVSRFFSTLKNDAESVPNSIAMNGLFHGKSTWIARRNWSDGFQQAQIIGPGDGLGAVHRVELFNHRCHVGLGSAG